MKNIGRRMFHLLAAAFCCSAGMLQSVYHSNFEVPHDVHIKKATGEHLVKFGAHVEYGVESTKGFDDQGSSVNAAQIYAPLESARQMLKASEALLVFPTGGYSATDFPEGLDWSTWSGGPLSLETNWGDFSVTANAQQSAMTLWGRVLVDYGTIPGQFFLGMSLPLRSMRVDNIAWTDLTDATLDADNPVFVGNLTSKLSKYVDAVSGLDINTWSKRGIGDASIYFGWANDIHHGDGALRKVSVHVSGGLSLPTGEQRDCNVAFSAPFGNDGSWGIPLSGGFNANVGDDVKLGVVVDLLWLTSKSKVRRLKTDLLQSEYLLLTKGDATASPGLTLKANLHGTYRCSESCKLSMAYQYIQHEKDVLSKLPTGYDVAIVNSLNSLGAWSSQDLTIKAQFEGFFGNEEGDERDGNEVNLSLFYKLPLAGKRSVSNASFGGELSFAF